MAEKNITETTEEETPAPLIDDLEAAWEEAETDEDEDKEPVNDAAKQVDKSEDKDEEKSEEDTDTEEETEDKVEAKEQEETEETDEGKADDEPPEHWDAAQKEDFESLPIEAKSLYLEKAKSLEAGYNKKFEEVANDRKEFDSYKPFKQIFEPHEQELAMAGTNPEAYTRQLLATAKSLAENPEKVLRQLATQYGVTLNGKADPAAEEFDEFTDPAIRALDAKIDGLSSNLEQSQQQSAANERQQAANREQEVEREWSAFVQAKGEGDAIEHPHATELRQVVGFELQNNPPIAGESNTAAFKRAYDIVKWQVPELRESLLASQSKAKDAEREKSRKADLAKAKKSGRVVKTKSKSVSEATEQSGTQKEELERAWDSASEMTA